MMLENDRIEVDGKALEIQGERSLLRLCLKNHIYIPHLCDLPEADVSPGSCRLCWVALRGLDGPVPSCRVRPEPGMVVETQTPAVRRLQKTAFQLLLSAHEADCGHCSANGKCELQKIGRFLGVGLKAKSYSQVPRETLADETHPALRLYPGRCVLCGRCIARCRSLHGESFLTFAKRGIHTRVTWYVSPEEIQFPCAECLACVEVCPVGALENKRPAESPPAGRVQV